MKEAPDKIVALEDRIRALEHKLKRAPGSACPKCGSFGYRVVESKPHPEFGDVGTLLRTMRCEVCEFQETLTVLPEGA